MSYEIAFDPEDAVEPEESRIAFSVEEFEEQVNRAERRRMKKEAEKSLPMKFVCPKCGYGERGGPISTMKKIVDEKTRKLREVRIPRYCRSCGGRMMKINDRRVTKKWVLKRAQKILQV